MLDIDLKYYDSNQNGLKFRYNNKNKNVYLYNFEFIGLRPRVPEIHEY